MRFFGAMVVLLAAATTLRAAAWEELFNGRNLDGWEMQSKADWRVEGGAIVVGKGKPGLLTTRGRYRDYELELEFRAAAGTNSGVFLSSPKTVTAPASECYELNIAPASNPYPTGSLVGRMRHDGGETREWRKFRVKVESGRVEVWLEGRKVIDYQDRQPLAGGHIGLQLNTGRVEFRAIRLRKIDLP